MKTTTPTTPKKKTSLFLIWITLYAIASSVFYATQTASRLNYYDWPWWATAIAIVVQIIVQALGAFIVAWAIKKFTDYARSQE